MKNRILLYAIIILLGSGISACNCSEKSASSPKDTSMDSIEAYAKKELGEDVTLSYNSTKEYVVISKLIKANPSDPFPTVQFQILQVSPMEALFRDAVAGGNVTWEDEHIVKVVSKKSIPGPDGITNGPKTYRYHAKNRKKFSGGFLKSYQ